MSAASNPTAPASLPRSPSAPDALVVDAGPEQLRHFQENGWVAFERITTDEEIAWLGERWDALFADRRSWYDVSQPLGRGPEDRLGQMIFPEHRAPELRETCFFANARRIAARLLGLPSDSLEAWGHMVLKPARNGHPTPWHQDESYWQPGFEYQALGCWLPLEDVDGENGCMCFLPGSHRLPLLPHRHLNGDPTVHLLELDAEVDLSAAVEVPLRIGGATFHHHRTLHSTAGNRTDRPRRAVANEFQTLPRRR